MAGDDDKPGVDEPGGGGDSKDLSEQGLTFSGDQEMTLDAFQKAVSQAVKDKLDSESPSAPAPRPGADEVVASVLSALTGKNAKDALAEVRESMSKPPAEAKADADNVIDLQAARQARRTGPASDFTGGIGDLLKKTFNSFIADVATRAGAGPESGATEVTLDAKFLRDNGPQLLGKLFESLAASLSGSAPDSTRATPKGPVDVDTALEGAAEEAGEDTPKESEAKRQGPVNVNFDVASILSALFRPKRPPGSDS